MLKFWTIVPIDEAERINVMRTELKILPVTGSVQVQALTEMPDVRPEQVARGKALIADPNYPSLEQLKKIARVLAANWNGADAHSDLSGMPLQTGEPQDRARNHAEPKYACDRCDRWKTPGLGRRISDR